MSTTLATSFFRERDFVDLLYIVAFSLFIYGLMGLTGPRTAVRGNRIAAVGMAIAESTRASAPRPLSTPCMASAFMTVASMPI